MEDEWMFAISTGAGLLGTWLLSLFGAFRWMSNRMNDVAQKSQERDDHLHTRLNRVSEDAVHKSDLTDLSAQLRSDIHRLENQQTASSNATNARFDALMNAIMNRNVTHNNPSGDK